MTCRLSVKDMTDNLEWHSTAENIAAVSSLGTVTALAKGEADITVKSGTQKSVCHVIVTAPAISMNHSDVELKAGETLQLSLQGTSQTPEWNSNNRRVASVDEKGLVTAIGAGSTTIYAKIAGKLFSCSIRVYIPEEDLSGSSRVLSRGEWISYLLTHLGIDTSVPTDTGDMLWYYSDTENTTYGYAAELAHQLGILPSEKDVQDVPVFNEIADATREFGAMTAVSALGFVLTEQSDLACSDSAYLAYPKHDAIAVQQGMLRLDENGSFKPNGGLTEQLGLQILQIIQDYTDDLTIADTDIVNDIEYAPDVLVDEIQNLNFDIQQAESGTYRVVAIGNGASNIKEGNVVCLPESKEHPNGFALKVTKIISRATNQVTFEAVVPENIADVVSSIEYVGHPTIAMEAGTQAITDELGNSYSMTYDPNGFIESENVKTYAMDNGISTYGEHGGSISIPGTFTFDFGDGIKLNDKAKLSGKVELEIPDITAKVNVDFGLLSGINVKEFTLSSTQKTKVSGQVKYTVTSDSSVSGSKEIQRIPIRFGYGLSADIVFSLYWDVNGKVGVKWTLVTTEGFQFKDGNLRWLGNVEHDFQLPSVEASAELGLKTALNLVFMEVWDLTGVDMKAGPKVVGNIVERPTYSLICLDAAVYLNGKVELNTETLLGEILKDKFHYTLEHEFWTSDNSPLRLHIHAENDYDHQSGFHVVEKCTARHGSLDGYVYDENHNRVSGARISLTREYPTAGESVDSLELSRKFTNTNGYYKLQDLPEGEYILTVSANGYNTFTIDAKISKDVCTQLDNIVLVKRNSTGNGTVCGTVVNALNNQTLSEVSYVVFKNWNNTSEKDVVQRGASAGEYTIDLPAGNYTILFSCENFASAQANISINENMSILCNVVMSPQTNHVDASSIRVVLTWGSTPRDLDSHLFGPTENGGTFHTYYNNQHYENHVALDRDDTDGYGPETTTVYAVENTGKYSFYVHDYTNRFSSDSQAMSNSSAKVEVYINDTLYAQLNIPVNKGGTVWHVFDYDVSSDDFTVFNTMTYSSNPRDLGITTTALYDDTIDSSDLTEEYAIGKIVSAEEKNVEEQLELPSQNSQEATAQENYTEESSSKDNSLTDSSLSNSSLPDNDTILSQPENCMSAEANDQEPSESEELIA